MTIQVTLKEFAKLIRECESNKCAHGCMYCALAALCGESYLEENVDFEIVKE